MAAIRTFLFVLTFLLFQTSTLFALPVVSSARAPTLLQKRRPGPTPEFSLRTRRIDPAQFKTFVKFLGYQVSYLGYDASKVEPHWQSLAFIPSMMELVRLQMSSFPNRRQFVPLSSNDHDLRIYAMPLFMQEFDRHRGVMGYIAGTGDNSGSQRAMILGVRRSHPLDLTLYRGPAGAEPAIIELYGIASFKHAATFHSRIENPWFYRHVAASLKSILRP